MAISEERKRVNEYCDKHHYEKCDHTVPTAFKDIYDKCKTPGKDACPGCIVSRITITLDTVRENLEDLGGIFKSKERYPDAHWNIMDYWDAASINGFKFAALLETFLESEVQDEDKKAAEEALDAWRKYRQANMIPPGMEKTYGKEVEQADGGAQVSAKATLKRGRTLDDDEDAPLPTKRVKISEFATISPDDTSIVPHPFFPPPSADPSLRDLLPQRSQERNLEQHQKTAYRGNDRHQKGVRRPYKRGYATYSPGRWASPRGFEKQDTSWCTEDEIPFVLKMEREETEWEVERERSEKLQKKFEEISRLWIEKRGAA